MGRNVTIRLDEGILRKCRHAAVEEDKFLSQWISDVLTRTVSSGESFEEARTRALRRLGEGFDLGGAPLSRDAAHGR
ncbi:MAG: hypothetical protein AB1505_29315 [Candidatus Latescibacterota bacterium]